MVAAVLNHPTLVLNRNWQPVSVATVARALVKVWTGTARVVDPVDYRLYTWSDWAELRPADGQPFVQTHRFQLRVPEVVTLVHYDRLPANSVAFSRRNVFKRDRMTCQYCGIQPGSEELTIDHVVPRARGGVTSWDNCVLACVACNTRKADRTPTQAGMTLRKKPGRPLWKPLYATRGDGIRTLAGRCPVDSWAKFVSDAYWNVELED